MEKENKKDIRVKSDRETRPVLFGDISPRDWFGKFFNEDFWLEPFSSWRIPRMPSRIEEHMFPRVDVSETDKEVKVVADVPGVNPDNIDIDIRDNRMVLSGKTERETETDKNARPYRYERSYGEFRREFSLPARVKEDRIKAVCKDGVLTITIPKTEKQKINKIKIEKQ